MSQVTVLILARNEVQNIADCINSVAFADQVIVIDDFSSDHTAQLASDLGATVIQHAMNGDWGQQQTFAVQQAQTPWILFLDADERISPELAQEIQAAIQQPPNTAYWIQRHNRFHHNQATHGTLRPDYVCRLLPTENTRVEGFVHPTIIHPYPNAKLHAPMYHYTYDNWEQYFRKFNQYTKLAAEKSHQAGKKAHFWRDIVLRPIWAFIKVYFFNKGFLDGKLGWIFAVNHYFYTMIKYVKLYYLDKYNGKL